MMGAPAEVVEKARAEEEAANVCDLHEDNAESVAAFVALETQWAGCAIGMAGFVFLGLNYGSIRPVLDLLEIAPERHPQVFADLRTMELAALPVKNQRPEPANG